MNENKYNEEEDIINEDNISLPQISTDLLLNKDINVFYYLFRKLLHQKEKGNLHLHLML